MSRLRSLIARTGIATRLLVGFLTIALVPCGILTAVTTYIARGSLEYTVRQRLLTLADAKTVQLENFIRERRGDAAVLGRSPYLVELVPQLQEILKTKSLDSPEYRQAAEKSRASLANFAAVYGYPNIHVAQYGWPASGLADSGVRPRHQSDDRHHSRTRRWARSFIRARTLLQSVLSDYQVYPGRRDPAAFIAGPILNDDVVVGIVIFEFGNQEVFRLFRDYNGLGTTGETQAAMRTGDELTFVAPLRHDPDAAFHTRIRFGSDRGVADAARGSGRPRLRRGGRLSRQAGGRCLVLSPLVPLGPGREARRRGSVRPDLPPAAGDGEPARRDHGDRRAGGDR